MEKQMENRKIHQKIVWGYKIELLSPLSVSSGEAEETDQDVQRDAAGCPFIPGTSVAGALRAYSLIVVKGVDKEQLFGTKEQNETQENEKNKDKEQSFMSSLIIGDLYFEKGNKIVTRDGVRLENKVAVDKNKFEMEVIDTGAKGFGSITAVIREGTSAESVKEYIKKLFAAVNQGEIYLGANKNRGLGRVKITKLVEKVFDRDNVDEWINFQYEDLQEKNDIDDITHVVSEEIRESLFVKIKVPLQLSGGIMIRKYSTKSAEVDFEHITSNQKAVVPGSSWNGAIRDRIRDIWISAGLQVNQIDQAIWEMFGYVEEEIKEESKIKRSKARQSYVMVAESEFTEGKMLPTTRNKISRFEAAAVNGALFTEEVFYEGKTVLELRVRKEGNEEKYKWMVGILLLAIKDLSNGYLAVGGQTAVGKGIFERTGTIEISEATEDEYLRSLWECRKEKIKVGNQ